MPVIRLFHGTAMQFDHFNPDFASEGEEPNSALGIHLTENAWSAADYAEIAGEDFGATQPTVLIVEVEVERMAVCSSREDFFGYCEEDFFVVLGTEGVQDIEEKRPLFRAARERLMAEGYDGVCVDDIGDDVDGTWVIFDPSKCRIVGRLTVKEAFQIEERPDYAGVAMGGDFNLEPAGLEPISPRF